MQIAFYIAAAIAIFATVMTITRLNAVHALLYLVVSLLAVAVVFFTLGAPFVAALEVIVYAGAIMVLFIFVVMLLNLGEHATETERRWLSPGIWTGPAVLAAVLIAQLAYLAWAAGDVRTGAPVGPKEVGIALYGPYVIGVELASMLLLGGLVGAYHLGRRRGPRPEVGDDINTGERRTYFSGDAVRAGRDRPAGAAQRALPVDVHRDHD
jgi:NADH-quinone oxidoreductase subunit J